MLHAPLGLRAETESVSTLQHGMGDWWYLINNMKARHFCGAGFRQLWVYFGSHRQGEKRLRTMRLCDRWGVCICTWRGGRWWKWSWRMSTWFRCCLGCYFMCLHKIITTWSIWTFLKGFGGKYENRWVIGRGKRCKIDIVFLSDGEWYFEIGGEIERQEILH